MPLPCPFTKADSDVILPDAFNFLCDRIRKIRQMAINTPHTDPREKRHSPRISFKSTVDLVSKGQLYKEMSENISDTGIFLKSKHLYNYTIFDKIILSFQRPDSLPAKYTGTVVRITKDGIGVLYSPSSPQSAYRPSEYRYRPRIDNLFRS